LSDSDTAKVKEAALEVVLPTWKKTCNSVDKTALILGMKPLEKLQV